MGNYNDPNDPRRTHRWRRVRLLVLDRDGYVCQLRLEGCWQTATTVDHLDAVMYAGSDPYDPARLVAACRHCNSVKGQQAGTRRVLGRNRW